ncbi:hypothetical protein TTRE_0000781201 [Trichuris trichiura]|uniref:Uncharacterized protein n=1 Tax=Trichuris trichiura TaxID=36087 RepID=A0A077ZGH2_TRITR|nr:hypothetical protein TTRE_0000781201 [Trichuris trichiura]
MSFKVLSEASEVDVPGLFQPFSLSKGGKLGTDALAVGASRREFMSFKVLSEASEVDVPGLFQPVKGWKAGDGCLGRWRFAERVL